METGLRDAQFIGSDSRSNFKNVLAKRSDLAKFAGGRIKKAASGLVTYEAGLVLGYASSGADAGRWKPYSALNSDGSEVAKAILAESVTVDSLDNGTEISMLVGGIVYEDLLIGLDAGAKSSLGARSYVEHGANLLDF